jgi:hypothetical protein
VIGDHYGGTRQGERFCGGESDAAGTHRGESLVANQYVGQASSGYGFPLLIKGLLESGVTRAREFAERVGRLASGLASLGVERGDTVDAGKKLVLLNDTGKSTQTVQTSLAFDAEYEAMLAAADP